MNYQSIYESLILKAKIRTDNIDIITENHHIIPRCMNGTNDAGNIVVLSLREHFVAHKLLYKIYKTKSLWDAFFMMATTRRKKRQFVLGSREYKLLKETASIKITLK